MQELFSALSLWLSAHPLITGWYTAIARLLFPVLSALILVRAIRSLRSQQREEPEGAHGPYPADACQSP